MAKRRTYLIQNPYAPEAQRFIWTIFGAFGLRPVCIYTDQKERHYLARHYPLLSDEAVEANIVSECDDLTDVADQVVDRFDVAAVIPWEEDFVAPSADLAERLGIAPNPASVVRRFRDKNDLKTLLRHRGIRVPTARIVRTLDDVYGRETPDRFVIKPNDGSGNLEVNIFDRDERDAVAAKLASQAHTWVLEEFIGGEEYHIDGQIRPDGTVDVLGVFQYRRTTVGDCDTVYDSERSIHTDEAVFDQCASYARRLLEASELRSSPFHMEVKVDERGPAMIDLGARLGSEGIPESVDRLHPGRPGMYWVAAHDHLGVPCAMPEIDWTNYDSVYEVFAYGISRSHGRIANITGMNEIERMPQFVTWNIRPRIGRPLVPTNNLGTVPWMAEFDVRGDLDDVQRVIDIAQRTVRLNVEPTRAERALAVSSVLRTKATDKARWMGSRLTDSASRLRAGESPPTASRAAATGRPAPHRSPTASPSRSSDHSPGRRTPAAPAPSQEQVDAGPGR